MSRRRIVLTLLIIYWKSFEYNDDDFSCVFAIPLKVWLVLRMDWYLENDGLALVRNQLQVHENWKLIYEFVRMFLY